MATRMGVDGTVIIPNAGAGVGVPLNLHIFEWSADLRRDVFDDTSFAITLATGTPAGTVTNVRKKVGGMADLVGTCRAWADRTDHMLIGSMQVENAQPSTGDFTLREGGSTAGGGGQAEYTFAGIIGSITIAVIKTDRVSYDISFESSGAVVAAA